MADWPGWGETSYLVALRVALRVSVRRWDDYSVARWDDWPDPTMGDSTAAMKVWLTDPTTGG